MLLELVSNTNSYFADMGKFMKPGKVVMVLAGRYAGRKAVIVKVLLTCDYSGEKVV